VAAKSVRPDAGVERSAVPAPDAPELAASASPLSLKAEASLDAEALDTQDAVPSEARSSSDAAAVRSAFQAVLCSAELELELPELAV
jgi:hypothetical protein